MKLFMPTKVYLENNSVYNHKDEWTAIGNKAMIVTGRHSSKVNGSLSDCVSVLSDMKKEYVIFDEIEENPSVETVVKAANIAKKEGIDFFIGIGGGSPMDAAKAIAILAKNIDSVENPRTFFYEQGDVDYYPLVEIPTTSGTGSEVTQYSILTLHDSHTKKSISKFMFADYALVDPKYLKTSSYNNMVNTCVDALAHMIESYLNTNSNELNRVYSKAGLVLWGKGKDYLTSKEDYENMPDDIYQSFMEASVLAGMAIAHTGTSLPHGLSYTVTYEYGVPHGKAVGIFLPTFMKTYDQQEDVKAILDALGMKSIQEFETYIVNILGKVKIDHKIMEENIHTLISNKAKLKNYPYDMTSEKQTAFLSVVL